VCNVACRIGLVGGRRDAAESSVSWRGRDGGSGGPDVLIIAAKLLSLLIRFIMLLGQGLALRDRLVWLLLTVLGLPKIL
jgi:hypothetical protein